MHHLAEALDEELIGDLDAADLGDAADIVAAEIEQHQMLGALLRIGEQLLLQRLVLVRRGAAPPRAGDRADGDLPPAGLDQDFRAGAGDGESAAIEKEQVRRRIDAPQGAIKRKRRKRERRLEALRQHDLEDVAGGDVFLGPQHHALEFLRRACSSAARYLRAGRRRSSMRRFVERPVERIDDRRQALGRARKRGLGGARRLAAAPASRR